METPKECVQSSFPHEELFILNVIGWHSGKRKESWRNPLRFGRVEASRVSLFTICVFVSEER